MVVTMATGNLATTQNSCFLLAKIYQVGKKEGTCFFSHKFGKLEYHTMSRTDFSESAK